MNARDAKDLGKWAGVVDTNIQTLARSVADLYAQVQRIEDRIDRQHKLIEMLLDTLKELAK